MKDRSEAVGETSTGKGAVAGDLKKANRLNEVRLRKCEGRIKPAGDLVGKTGDVKG